MLHALTYDTQPAHSRLRREFADGMLRVIARPEEPGPLVRRGAMLRAAVPASLICAAVLVVSFVAVGATYQANRRFIPSPLSGVLLGACLVFGAATFALVLRAQYSSRLDAARHALQQSTIIAVSPGRILIETTGPMGTSSHDLTGRTWSFRVGCCSVPVSIDHLQIVSEAGSSIQVLAGRDNVELRWVARTLRSGVSGNERCG
jgi:hypothetical protein